MVIVKRRDFRLNNDKMFDSVVTTKLSDTHVKVATFKDGVEIKNDVLDENEYYNFVDFLIWFGYIEVKDA